MQFTTIQSTRDSITREPSNRTSTRHSYTSMQLLGLLGSILMLTSCAQCAPGMVGAGVARLSVRNAGAIVSIISNDTTCGFASDQVGELV